MCVNGKGSEPQLQPARKVFELGAWQPGHRSGVYSGPGARLGGTGDLDPRSTFSPVYHNPHCLASGFGLGLTSLRLCLFWEPGKWSVGPKE